MSWLALRAEIAEEFSDVRVEFQGFTSVSRDPNASRARYIQHRAAGLCVDCSSKAEPGKCTCYRHRRIRTPEQSQRRAQQRRNRVVGFGFKENKMPAFTTEELASASRVGPLVRARHVAAWQMRQSGMTLTAIGAVLGGRDHKTVMHSVRRGAEILREIAATEKRT